MFTNSKKVFEYNVKRAANQPPPAPIAESKEHQQCMSECDSIMSPKAVLVPMFAGAVTGAMGGAASGNPSAIPIGAASGAITGGVSKIIEQGFEANSCAKKCDAQEAARQAAARPAPQPQAAPRIPRTNPAHLQGDRGREQFLSGKWGR